MAIRIGVLTVSDRCSQGTAIDESGPAVVQAILSADCIVTVRKVIEDKRDAIAKILRVWADKRVCDVIFTTGGTGFSKRDVTPEATSDVIDRQASNLAAYIQQESTKLTPFAALSRGVCGIRKKTIIVNLPGTPKGARECALIVLPLIAHAVSVLTDGSADHPT
jgi:molybdenum cofactor synthesis domain-containing protein